MDPNSRPQSTADWNKQVYNPESDLEVVPKSYPPAPHNGIEVYNSPLPEDKIAIDSRNGARSRRICGLRRKWSFILLGVIALVVIGAAAGGTVDATQGNKSSSSSSTPSADSGLAGSASNATSSAITGLSTNSSLAAVSYNDSAGTMQYRVYYQDENDMIKESAWNATFNTWYVSNDGIGKVKPGSTITAAAIGPPSFDFVCPSSVLTRSLPQIR